MLVMVDVEGMEMDAAINAWLASNEDIWKKWIP
jgi:ABC-type proline/glycine betaine transport system substrate-binding protein